MRDDVKPYPPFSREEMEKLPSRVMINGTPDGNKATLAWDDYSRLFATSAAAVERGVRETPSAITDEEVGRAIQLFRGFHDFPVSKVRMDYDGAPMRRVLEDFVSTRSGRGSDSEGVG